MWGRLRLRLLNKRRPGVALVTTDVVGLHGGDEDLPHLVGSLSRRGVRTRTAVWHDPTVSWNDYDLLILRSPWDYTHRFDEFNDWFDGVSNRVEVLNCGHTVRWNLDKSYLLSLAAAGVPVIPTQVAATAGEVDEALAGVDAEAVVVKPLVGAGSSHAGMFEKGDPAAVALASRILSLGRQVAVQPAIPSVAKTGEKDLVFIDGEFSHAVTKGPILAMGGELIDGSYRETIEPYQARPSEVALASKCLESLSVMVRQSGCDCYTCTPLYARFDLVDSHSGPLLLEAEVFEPSLFVGTAPASAERFAEAVIARLG
jgi:glutathione synthase/RimK-type ligase-like ATP-grasp enzyme